jgi:hypothetical protein
MRHLTTRVLAAAVLLFVAAAGCALAVRRPSIAELHYNSGRYYDKRVAIEGEVTSAWGLPLVPLSMYKVSDGTGEVTVLSQGSRIPSRGARVRVTGRVSELAVLGGRPLGLHIREHDVDFRRW